jgi:hypothetical protein
MVGFLLALFLILSAFVSQRMNSQKVLSPPERGNCSSSDSQLHAVARENSHSINYTQSSVSDETT